MQTNPRSTRWSWRPDLLHHWWGWKVSSGKVGAEGRKFGHHSSVVRYDLHPLPLQWCWDRLHQFVWWLHTGLAALNSELERGTEGHCDERKRSGPTWRTFLCGAHLDDVMTSSLTWPPSFRSPPTPSCYSASVHRSRIFWFVTSLWSSTRSVHRPARRRATEPQTSGVRPHCGRPVGSVRSRDRCP